MVDDTWAGLADQFADEQYASVKGIVRTYVIHQQLIEHLALPPARILDVGGGAGHQSFPLARAGYEVTILDPSAAMLDKARERLKLLPPEAREKVTFVQARGEDAAGAVDAAQFSAVLCHGVLGYMEDPAPIIDQLCRCTEPGGIVSIMASNAGASAMRPAMEQRWAEALAAFDSREEIGVLGLPTYANTVDELAQLLRARSVEPLDWYGIWHFVDWLDLAGNPVDPTDKPRVRAAAAVELEASRRDPYRQLSRIFHLLGRKQQ